MFEYEIATARSNDLIRQADTYRLIREAKKARRSFSRSQNPEGPVRGRVGFTRAA